MTEKQEPTSRQVPASTRAALEAYVLDADDTALTQALKQARTDKTGAPALLAEVLTLRGDPVRKRQATHAIRKHYGLPLIPGPPCRS